MANRLSTTTNSRLLPKFVDTVFRSNVLTTRVLAKPDKWNGEKLRKAIIVSKNDQGSSFSGFDALSTTAVDTRRYFEFSGKFYQIPISIPFTEMTTNLADENRLIDLARIEMEVGALSAADQIGDMFYSDGTGNSSKDFEGLSKIVDDGTTSATYGGLTRTTFSPNISSTVTASGGQLTLAKMATLYNAVSDGSVKPTMGICDPTVFSLYEALIEPKNRIYITVSEIRGMKDGLSGTAGFTGLSYKGFPIMADRKATASTLFFLNEDFLHFNAFEKLPAEFGAENVKYRVTDIDGNDYTNIEGLGFSWTGWVRSTNQMAITGRIVIGGEFWTSNPRRHGKLTGVTSS